MKYVVATTVFFGLFLYPILALTFSSGPPSRRTGAPGDSTCQGCHSSFQLNSGSGNVSITAPTTYTPGETVDLTVRVSDSNASLAGFEITVQSSSGAFIGEFELTGDGNTRFTPNNQEYVSHTSSGVTQNEWNVRWKPPASGMGDVTFYAAGVAADGGGTNQNDHVYTTNVTVADATATAIEDEELAQRFALSPAYPNPFNPQTQFTLTLAEAQEVDVMVFDLLGQRVATVHRGALGQGAHTLHFTADHLPSGTYIIHALGGRFSDTQKVVLLK